MKQPRSTFARAASFGLALACLFSAPALAEPGEGATLAFQALVEAESLDAAAYESAREDGLTELNVFEAKALRTLRGSGSDVAGLVEEYEAVSDSFAAEDSFLFGSEREWRGMGSLLRARQAMLAGEEAAFEEHAKEAFWLSPEMAPLLVEWISGYRQDKAMASYTMPMDLELRSADGGTTTLAALGEGKKAILLDFWASWCGPCMQLMPELKKKAALLAPQGVVVAGMNTENLEDARGVKEERAIDFPWLVEPEERPYSRDLGIDSIPRMILVTPEGKVLYNGHPMDPRLESVLAELGVSLEEGADTTETAAETG
jgi:thiol-disulfide isomerase/thioredoxin